MLIPITCQLNITAYSKYSPAVLQMRCEMQRNDTIKRGWSERDALVLFGASTGALGQVVNKVRR